MKEFNYVVDWDYLREQMLLLKGSDSYMTFIESVPGMGKTTAYRFLKGERDLDLANLLIAVDACNLFIEHVIVDRQRLPHTNPNESID